MKAGEAMDKMRRIEQKSDPALKGLRWALLKDFRLVAPSFRQSGRYTPCEVTASTPEPEGGARCVSSARRDLRGGAGSNPRLYRDP
jgi:hypothetical protein